MKCGACGYRNTSGEAGWDEESKKLEAEILAKNPENKDFIHIEGHFTTEVWDWHKSQEKVGIYACPKCKTLKVVSWHI